MSRPQSLLTPPSSSLSVFPDSHEAASGEGSRSDDLSSTLLVAGSSMVNMWHLPSLHDDIRDPPMKRKGAGAAPKPRFPPTDHSSDLRSLRLRGWSNWVWQIRLFSRLDGGYHVAVAGGKSTILLCDVSKDKGSSIVGGCFGHTEPTLDVQVILNSSGSFISDDGGKGRVYGNTLLVSSSADKTVKVWRAPLPVDADADDAEDKPSPTPPRSPRRRKRSFSISRMVDKNHRWECVRTLGRHSTKPHGLSSTCQLRPAGFYDVYCGSPAGGSFSSFQQSSAPTPPRIFTGATRAHSWDLETGSRVRSSCSFNVPCDGLERSPQHRLLFSGLRRNVSCLDENTLEVTHVLRGAWFRRDGIASMLWCPRRNELYVSTRFGHICVYDVRIGSRLLKVWRAHRGPVYGMQQVVAGAFATASNDNTAKIWKFGSKKPLRRLLGDNDLCALCYLGMPLSSSDDPYKEDLLERFRFMRAGCVGFTAWFGVHLEFAVVEDKDDGDSNAGGLDLWRFLVLPTGDGV